MTAVLVCCGAGGVGKTTLSAALALRLASGGRSVAVLTIDPARRLADSLGLSALGDEPHAIQVPGVPGARLDALVLDAKATFDRLVRRFAPSAEAAGRILGNRYYGFASTRLTGTHEYMALERLQELVESGRYDAIVLDTPPTRHALEFLTAPERLGRFLDHRVLRVLALPRTVQGMERLRAHAGAIMSVLDRLVGASTLREIAELIAFLEDLTDALATRVREVRAELRAARFYLITTPQPEAQAEALAFLRELRSRGLPFCGVLVNRCAPRPSVGEPPLPDPLPAAPVGLAPPVFARVLAATRAAGAHYAGLAAAEAQALERLRRAAGLATPLWTVPSLPEEASDLEALGRLGAWLPDLDDR